MEQSYGKLLLQKYRLAVVLAVLKSKPNNLSVQEYIMELREKIRESESQSISVDEDDFNMTDEIELNTCFNIDDNSNESVTILQHFEHTLNDELINRPDEILLQSSDSQATQNNVNRILPTKKNIDTNLEIATNDTELKHRVECNLLKHNELNSQSTLPNIDSQGTNACYTQNYTHISQSQNCITFKPYLLKNDKFDMKRKNESQTSEMDKDSEIQIIRKKVKPIVYTESICADIHETQYDTQIQGMQGTNNVHRDAKDTNTISNVHRVHTIDTDTINTLSNVYRDHIIDTNTINTLSNVHRDHTIDTDTINTLSNVKILENMTIKPKDNKEIVIFDSMTNLNSQHNKAKHSTRLIDYDDYNDVPTYFEENPISQDILTLESGDSPNPEAKQCESEIQKKRDSDDISKIEYTEKINGRTREYSNHRVTQTNENSENIQVNDCDTLNEDYGSQRETIPFKVMGEFNKIKAYLNRDFCDSHGSDSGFKSSRSSIYMASQSTHWINQSSHCLFTYLTRASLFESTHEINCEISKVLGEVIDKLHDNEKYPTFLDEMLDFIANIISNIYEGKCNDGNAFFKTNESIERLLLLNESQNLLKYTIENIVKILTTFYECLDETIELTDINRTENLAYILHLLETLLRKHKLSRATLSQSSRFSQSHERSMKRSAITEIWRSKWNLTQVEVSQNVERDVLIDCSDILNKIIVKAMNNYSLIAFAALQCFNLLQD